MSDIALEGFGLPADTNGNGYTPGNFAGPSVPDPTAAATPPPEFVRPEPGTTVSFWLPGPFFTYREKRQEKTGRCPAPKGRGKVARQVPGKGFATVTDSPATKAAEAALVDALYMLPMRPRVPWEGPIRMDVDFVFTPPTSGPAWRLEACLANAIGVTSNGLGDRDNLHKLLADAMEKAHWYTQDSRLTEGDVRKRYGPEPGYKVKLTAIREVQSFAEWKAMKAARG